MSGNPFHWTHEHPYHISVGAVLRDREGKIAVHHFTTEEGEWYMLMRETIEPNESLEVCLARGLMEEFGAVGTLVHFIGAITCPASSFTTPEHALTKTTLYFLCDVVSLDEELRPTGEFESMSQIEWKRPEELIPLMHEQSALLSRADIDESSVLERLI